MPPRKRNKENKHLPPYWRHRYGAYYIQVPKHLRHKWDGKAEFRLGKTLDEAYKAYFERLEFTGSDYRIMSDVFERYLLEHIPTLSPGGQSDYKASIRRLYPVFGKMKPYHIKPAHAYEYHDKCSNARGNTTAKHDVGVLRHTLTMCVKWGVVDRNPILGQVRIQNNPPRDRLVEDWEIAELMKVTGNQKRPIELLQCYIELKLMTGLRRKDILDLTLDNLRDDGIHVQPSKTKKSSGKRLIIQWDEDGDLDALVKRIKKIKPQRIGNAHLFTTVKGRAYGKNSFDSLWQRFMDRAMQQTKITDRFQERDLRAKVASDSDSLIEASERLGHASTETTKRVYRRRPVSVLPLKRK